MSPGGFRSRPCREINVSCPISFSVRLLRALFPLWAPLLTLLCLNPSPCQADRILLTNGRVWEGHIIDQSPDSIVIQTVGGPVTVPRSAVQLVEKAKTRDEIYRDRADALSRDDVNGHFLLALWCEDQHLPKEARYHFYYVIGLDPDHEGARKALGYDRYQGKWMTDPEINQAKGLVLRKGRWLTPAQAADFQAAEAREARKTSLLREVQRLARVIADTRDYRERLEAEKALWRLHDPLAHPAIAALLDSPVPQVRLAALKAIKKLDIRDIPGRLVRVALFDPEDDLRSRAQELLVPLYNPQVRQILLQALRNEDKSVNSAAACVLGAVKDPSTVPALIDALYFTYHYRPGEAAPVLGIRTVGAPQPPPRTIPLDQPPDSPDVFIINYDALDALKAITGQDFGTSKRDWLEWWTENEPQISVWTNKPK